MIVHSQIARIFQILLEHIQTKGMMERMISSDDKIGNSPLHLAAESGFTKIVKVCSLGKPLFIYHLRIMYGVIKVIACRCC